MPKFHDLGNATENCANSSESLSKSKTFISGLPEVVSTVAKTAQPFDAVGVIACAGTQIVSLPTVLVYPVLVVTVELNVAAPAADISKVNAVITEPPSFPLNIMSLSDATDSIVKLLLAELN